MSNVVLSCKQLACTYHDAGLAVEVLKLKPDCRHAHYLMGMVHENDREWELAAEAYRTAYAGSVD